MCAPIVKLCYCDAVTDFPYGDGQIGFVGKDVAEVLGYANYRNAIAKHVDEEEKLRTQIEYAGQKREIILINESGALLAGAFEQAATST